MWKAAIVARATIARPRRLDDGGETGWRRRGARSSCPTSWPRSSCPAGELRIELEGPLAGRLDPPGSGGLLVALAMWRRLLVAGPEKFGEVYYLGHRAARRARQAVSTCWSAPMATSSASSSSIPTTGNWPPLEMTPEEDTDPCELYFSDYREVEGRMLPGRIEVRHGDDYRQVLQCQHQLTFAPRSRGEMTIAPQHEHRDAVARTLSPLALRTRALLSRACRSQSRSSPRGRFVCRSDRRQSAQDRQDLRRRRRARA